MEKIIWNSNIFERFPNDDDNLQEYKDWAEINCITIPTRQDELEAAIIDFLEQNAQWDLDDLIWEINHQEKKEGVKEYVVKANLGLWNGRAEGGKVISGLRRVFQMTSEDYTKIYIKNKRLHVEAVHHDGTNYYDIKQLTERGENYYENHKYDKTDREMIETLFGDSHYSHEVNMFNKIYG